MGAPAQNHAAPRELDVRMVVLGLGQLADAVDERQRLGEVLEPELTLEGAVDLVPSVGRAHAAEYAAR